MTLILVNSYFEFVSNFSVIKNPFGLFSMLLESLQTHPVCIIDDFLCDPATSTLLQTKIRFSLEYTKPSKDAKSFRLLVDPGQSTLTQKPESDNRDHVSTHLSKYLKNKKHWNLSRLNNSKEPNLTKLLSNTIIEMSHLEDKNASEELTRDIMKAKSDFLMSKTNANIVTSWLVRVNIIELKNVSGRNENVYLTVEIGDKLFRTRGNSMSATAALKYDELFRHEIENIETYEVMNLLVKITV